MEIRAPEMRESAESTAAAFIARRDVGPWTESDAAALQSWLAESVSHRVAYYRLNAAWVEVGRLQALGAKADSLEQADRESAAVGAGEILSNRAHDHEKPSWRGGRRNRWIALAASFVLAALALSVWYELGDPRNRYSTPIGATETLPLADGSRILLNTDSAVRVLFTAHERLVALDRGEAYFEVAHNTARPFIVKVGERRVVAVGTQFAVRRDDENLRVSVTDGTVRLEGEAAQTPDSLHTIEGDSRAPKDILLPAGSIARVEAKTLLVQKRSVAEVEQSLSWRAGVLTFRDTPLADAVAEFNRYNTRKIVIDDSSIGAFQVGGIFRASNIDSFVRLLEQGLPVRATDQGDRILLTARH